jgi:competence protein ComEC
VNFEKVNIEKPKIEKVNIERGKILDRTVLLALSLWLGALLALNSKGLLAIALILLTLSALTWLIIKERNVRASALTLILLITVGAFITITHQQAKSYKDLDFTKKYTLTFTARSDSSPLRERVYGSKRSEKRCSLKAEMQQIIAGELTDNRSLPIRVISTLCDLSFGERVLAVGKFAPSKEARMSALFIADQISERQLSSFWRAINGSRVKFRSYFQESSFIGAILVPGMVIGDTLLQDREFQDLMQRVGLSHLTAVSGTNFAIVSTFILAALSRTVKNFPLRIAISALSLILFTFIVRPTPSVLRAAVMAAVLLLAKVRGSARDGFTALGLAVLLLIAIDPFQAIELGFVLSVLATAGILIISPPLTKFFIDRFHAPKLASELVAIPLSASIFCTPVIVAISDGISLAQVPINIAVAPFVPVITIAGFLTFLTQFIFTPFQFIPELGAQIASFFAIAVVKLADFGLNFPILDLPGGLGGGVLATLLIFSFLYIIYLLRSSLIQIFIFLTFIFTISFLLPKALNHGSDDWQILQCDVGQGDALLIRTSPKSAAVIDVGPDPEKMDRCLRAGKIKKISLLVITHFHADHIAGISALVRGREVERWWLAPMTERSTEVLKMISLLKSEPIEVKAGDSFTVGANLFHVIWPEEKESAFAPTPGDGSYLNNRSITMIIEKEGALIFAGGDIEPPVQEIIAAKYDLSQIDIYKVSHHGSKFRSDRFDQELNPELALISVGAGNPFGHPADETMEKFKSSLIGRTDQMGTIKVKWWPLEISH